MSAKLSAKLLHHFTEALCGRLSLGELTQTMTDRQKSMFVAGSGSTVRPGGLASSSTTRPSSGMTMTRTTLIYHCRSAWPNHVHTPSFTWRQHPQWVLSTSLSAVLCNTPAWVTRAPYPCCTTQLFVCTLSDNEEACLPRSSSRC